ncbi:hypothetical protein BM221_003283 [Beauveria bassiana]|uniref:Uncharacterized protein n=1 Tax=Beauveria bassiana TaxID=176275 RepID=A0A2N6NU82_BEABA|nr:hypothetical protein BM221_003283 [Beauveria bassiana]
MHKHGADDFTCLVTELMDSCENCHKWWIKNQEKESLANTDVPGDIVVWEDSVPSPSEVNNKGREKLQSIIPAIENVPDKIGKGMYADFVGDMVDALAVPVVMAQQSV